MIKKKLFKWVGGKKWMKKELENILSKIKTPIEVYIEPCAGGLGSFLALSGLLLDRGVSKIYLNDVNDVLISVFNDILSYDEELFKEYMSIENEYARFVPNNYIFKNKKTDKKEATKVLEKARDFYLEKRVEYNSNKSKYSIRRSALFIFLMQHLYNGIYRESKKSGLNSPYNWEPNVANEKIMRKIFNEYKNLFGKFEITFSSDDVFEFMNKINKKSLKWENVVCYIDPPYKNKKNNELNYNQIFFGNKEHEKLLQVMVDSKINNIIYSNHDLPIFREFAKENDFKTNVLIRKVKINPLNINFVNELLLYKILQECDEK